MKPVFVLIAVLSDWTHVTQCTPFPPKRPNLLNFRFSNDSVSWPSSGTRRRSFGNPVPPQEDLASGTNPYNRIRRRGDSEDNPRPDRQTYPDGNPRPSNLDVCGYPQVSMNATLWDSKQQNETVHWVVSNLKAYTEWVKESDQNRLPFQSYLSKAWLKDAGISECNGYYCDVLSCENMVDGYDKDRTRTAFYAMRNIANWNNYQKQLQDDTIQAIDNIRSRLDILVNDFTDSKKLKAYRDEQERKKKMLLHILLAIILIVSALTGFIDPAIMPLAGAIGAVAEEGLKQALNVGKVAVNAASGSLSGATALVTDAMGKGEDPADGYRSGLHRLFEGMADFVSHDMRNETMRILSGMKGTHGLSIIDIAASPAFLKKRMADPNRVRQLETRVEEMVINVLWRQQWVYIVEAETKSCVQDTRIWDRLKVCRADDDLLTYQTLFIGTELEQSGSTGTHQLIQGPPGWQKLGKAPYANINLGKIVFDSEKHFATRGYKFTDEAHFKEQLLLPGNYALDKSPPSQWTIPILRSAHGEALTTIMNKKGRNYPLMAGLCPWRGPITAACNQELHDFLEATSLYMSKSWKHAADAYDVKFDESVTWQFEGADNSKVVNKHPITLIKHHPDQGYLGHEEEKDDGTDDHDDGKAGWHGPG